MSAPPLTKEERLWISKLQRLLDECPSKRFGFYTTGHREVTVVDLPLTEKYYQDKGRPDLDYCTIVQRAGTDLGELRFPAAVQSTSG